MTDLPMTWVEKIFTKLTLVYGRDFLSRWEGIDLALVKDDWGHELAGFQNFPEGIAYALQNLPAGKPPTVQDFKAMARKAPEPEFKALPAPNADPAVVAETMAKAAEAVSVSRKDPKEWARRIVGAHTSGEKVSPIRLKFAREALGVAA